MPASIKSPRINPASLARRDHARDQHAPVTVQRPVTDPRPVNLRLSSAHMELGTAYVLVGRPSPFGPPDLATNQIADEGRRQLVERAWR